VYLIDGSNRSNRTLITSSNVETGGRFGFSVASVSSGGQTDMVVGARDEDSGGFSDAGRAYIIDGANPTGTPVAIQAPQPQGQAGFGYSVEGTADIDGDGKGDVIIGAPFETLNGKSDAGSAYIFSNDGTGSLIATLTSPDPDTNGRFGFDLTGAEQPIVGAPREDGGAEKAGRVHRFFPGTSFVDGRDGESYTPPLPTPGESNEPIGRFRISAGGTGAVLTDVTISDAASVTPSGIESVELWTSTDNTFEASTDTEIASAPSYATSVDFTGLNTPVPFKDSPLYVFVVVDLAANAGGDYEPVIRSEDDLTFDGGRLALYNGAPTSVFTDAFLSDASTPLPVELAAFDADVTDDRSVRLQWKTTSETGNSGFRVQRSVSGTSWSTLGRVEGAGTTDEPQSYRFTDSAVPYASDSLQYRLAQVDVDGTVNVSDPVTVRFGNPDGLELLGSFPNPARSQATVRFAVPEQTTGDVQLELYDLLGRQVKTIPAAEASGRVEQTLDVSDLPSGTYLLRLSAGGQTQTQQVTIVR
jgi:hypothetical protein